MSAFVVSEKHIQTLVLNMRRYAGETDFDFYAKHVLGINAEHPDYTMIAVANVLWAENNKSVNFRYGERMKAPITKNMLEAEEVDIAQFHELLRCYEYQTCEHKSWERSKVFRFIAKIREEIMRRMILKDHATSASLAKWSI